MKAKTTLLFLALFLLVHSAFAGNDAQIKMMNRGTAIYVGDSLLIRANYFNVRGQQEKKDLLLSVSPDSLGVFSGNTFISKKVGFGAIQATFGEIKSRFEILVLDTVETKRPPHPKDSADDVRAKLRILPVDTIVAIGSVIRYRVEMLNDSSQWIGVDADWRLEGHQTVGRITSEGKVEVTGNGVAYVEAKTAFGKTMTRLISQPEIKDTTLMNTISITKVLPNGRVVAAKKIHEGQKFTIGGLPAPLHLLNGAQIYFPIGSLHENIELRIQLPVFARVDSFKNVEFQKKVLNAVSFDVYINNQHIQPYHFDLPLNVTIPFKKGLINRLGLDVTKLSLYYASDSLDLEARGISNIVVDTINNQITSNVSHFSNLALTEADAVLSVRNTLSQNQVDVYPNPVSDFLTINLKDLKAEASTVRVSNLLGLSALTAAATSTVMDLNLTGLSAGVYHVQILDKEGVVLTTEKIVKK